jgi:diguanylate cyclase (GGDEF)-like protein
VDYETSPVVRLTKDDFGLILSCDETISSLVGWSAQKMVGSRSLEYVHPDDYHTTIASWMALLESPEAAHTCRWRHRCSDERFRWVEVTNHNRLATEGYVLSEIRASGEEAQADEVGPDAAGSATMVAQLVREQELFLHHLIDNLPTGVALSSLTGNLVYVNARMRELLEAFEATTVGELLVDAAEEDRSLLDNIIGGLRHDCGDIDLELRLTTAGNGFPRRLAINVRALSDMRVLTRGSETRGALICATDVTEAAQLRDELVRQATSDALTGCHNRAATFRFLDEVLGSGSSASVVFVDINALKEVNDLFGHAAGDELLVDIAARLRSVARRGDLVGRIGGDEFLVVCTGVGDADAARASADRVAAALLGATLQHTPRQRSIASIGVAWTNRGAESADDLVAAADTAMYQAKRSMNPRPQLFGVDLPGALRPTGTGD